jgi:hypothetical protein
MKIGIKWKGTFTRSGEETGTTMTFGRHNTGKKRGGTVVVPMEVTVVDLKAKKGLRWKERKAVGLSKLLR